MRIQTTSDFGERPTEVLHERTKCFLIYEGEVTEPMYFNGICENRKRLAIKETISIINVLRSLDDKNKSHPKFALKLIADLKLQSKENVISKENLLKSIKDFIINNDTLENKENLINMASNYILEYASDYIDYNDIENVIIDIYKDNIFENITNDIIEYLNNQKKSLDYVPNIDEINLIVDRDKGNFKEEQYDALIKKCQEDKINLYVSNPCFEVWLLMHFKEFENLDFQKLLENKRVSGKKYAKKYSEKMLSNIIGYDKSNLKFDMFVNHIEEAIKREKNYCEDVKKLKDNVGSNVGKLIAKMQK